MCAFERSEKGMKFNMKKNEKVFWIVTILILIVLSIMTISYFRGPKRLEIENKDNGIVDWDNVDSVN